jgi:hypothetical protein
MPQTWNKRSSVGAVYVREKTPGADIESLTDALRVAHTIMGQRKDSGESTSYVYGSFRMYRMNEDRIQDAP